MKLEILCYINENLSVTRYWIISRRSLSESAIFTTVKVSEFTNNGSLELFTTRPVAIGDLDQDLSESCPPQEVRGADKNKNQ